MMSSNPLTPETMDKVARTFETLERRVEAEKEAALVLAIKTDKLGGEHLDTLDVAAQFASLRHGTVQHPKATEMITQNLETTRRIRGDDNPRTLERMTRLLNILLHEKSYREAAVVGEQVVERSKRILGEEHPETLHRMVGLACVMFGQQRYREGIGLFESAFNTCAKIFGHDHARALEMSRLLQEWTF